jgi:protein kinase-like protein
MEDLLATSTFLHDSCFSVLYSAYHPYSTMLPQDVQLESRALDVPDDPPGATGHPMHVPISQNWDDLLMDALGVPITPIPPIAPPGARTPILRVDVLRKTAKTLAANKIDVNTFSTSFISRMYSAQLPGHSTPGTELNSSLRQELNRHIIDTDTNFITSYLFPPSRSPFPINDNFLKKISASYKTSEDKQRPAIWNSYLYQPRNFPSQYTEIAIANWLNEIGEALAHFSGRPIRRVWSHRNCDKAPDGCNIKRKPDIILVNKDYLAKLSSANAHSDWNFIQALCEVTSQLKTSSRIIDTINAKSFIMFATQHNRRFVIALSLTGNQTFRLTVTDHEGQIRHNETALDGKRPTILFFTIISFLMFGDDADIGLDPNIVIGPDGRVKTISVDNKCFVVKKLIHSVETLIGRATKVWIVFDNDAPDTLYILKDSWIQVSHVDSEVSFLKQMSVSTKLEGRVPKLICGGDVTIESIKDCTGQYRVDLAGYPHSQRVHRRIVTSTIGEPITMFRSKKEFLNVMISLLKSK